MARFAAIGLDHRHIYDLTQGLLDAGQVCAGYWPETTDPRVLAGFRKRFPDVAAYPGTPETIQIIGSLGTARMEAGNLRVSWLDGREEKLEDAGGSGGGASVMAFSHEPHKALMTDFLDAIETGRDPAVTGEDALATQRVIASILSKGAG